MMTVIEWTNDPAVPVSVTEYEAAVAEPTVRLVEICWSGATLTELLLSDVESPAEDETERLTVPENPLTLVRVICEVDGTPAWTCKEEGPLKRKSTTFTDMKTEWDRGTDPEVPVAVTVTVKSPATAELTVRVEVLAPPSLSATLVGLRVVAALVVERVTIPLKLLILERVRIVLLDEPA
jgi:hypothetical protein